MSNVTNVQSGQPVMQNQQVQAANETTAPAVLQNARPSAGSTVCRVLAGIFTLGISEGILAICRHIEANAAPKARGAGEALPAAAPTIAEQNHTLSEQFKNDTLAPEFKAAVSEAFSELRASYGKNSLPQGTTVQEILANPISKNGLRENAIIREAAKAIKNSETEVSPQDLKKCIIEKASPELAVFSARACIMEHAENKISSNRADIIFNALIKDNPEFGNELAACKNAEEVKTCVLNQATLAEHVEYSIGYCEYESTSLQHIFNELASVTGKSTQEIQDTLSLTDLKSKFSTASSKFTGDMETRLQELKTALQEISANFIQMKSDLYTSIARLTVSEGLKEQLRNDVFGESTLKKGYVFARAEQAVDQVNVSSLIRVLQEGNNLSDADVTGMIKAVSVQLSDAITQLYSARELADLGADGNALTMSTACQILIDKNPEIVELMKSDPAKIDRMLGILLEQTFEASDQLESEEGNGTEATLTNASSIYGSRFILNTVRDIIQANNSIMSSLQTGTGEGRFAQITHDTLAGINAEYGINIGTNLNELANLPFGNDVIKNIANRITAQNQLLSSAQFVEIVRSELQTHVANLAAKAAISERCAELGLDTKRLPAMLTSLKKLYPQLQESINNADSKENIQALLLSCGKYENILRRESDIHTYSTQIMKDTLARLAVLLGVNEADVRTTMNLDNLETGFRIVEKGVFDDGNVSDDGIVADIQGRFQRVADRFVKGKSDLIALVNGNELAISPELRANWLNEINANISLKNPVLLQGSYNVGQRMDGSSLLRALRDGLDRSDLLGLFKSLSAQIDEYSHLVFTQEQYNNMGSDETGLISQLAREAFWDKNAKLKSVLLENSANVAGLQDDLENEFSELQARLTREPDWANAESLQIRREIGFIVNAMALLGDVFGPQE